MSACEGLKHFRKDAKEALMWEWLQLDKLDVYYGVFEAFLTPIEHRRALCLVQLIKCTAGLQLGCHTIDCSM
jgi:hypothetical protein